MTAHPASGFSLVELLVVAAVVAAAAAAGLPIAAHAADAADAAGAARHLASLIARARVEAARRQRVVALRVEQLEGDTRVSLVADGDGDGVTAADVAAGTDVSLRPPETIGAHFVRARLGIAGGVRGLDGEPLTSLDDPVRLGAADQLSVGPLGTSTSGTIYVASRGGVQYAVRIAGVTGRVRVLRYVLGAGLWRPE
ncbi:MAG: GspH/FimT family pseudopilin [Vicinamibacterales bacterium]